MTERIQNDELPGAGFLLTKLYAVEQTAQVEDADATDLPAERPVKIAWDWRVLGPREFEVLLALGVGPAKPTPERLSVTMVGRFMFFPGEETVPAKAFARYNALAFLFPYGREALTSLSARGPFGPYILPPVNMAQVAADLPNATIAETQFRDDRSLEAVFSGDTSSGSLPG